MGWIEGRYYLLYTTRSVDGVGIGRGVAGPVEEVVVMQVHEDSHRLPQQDAGPHNHIPNLPSGEGEGRDHPQGNLNNGN